LAYWAREIARRSRLSPRFRYARPAPAALFQALVRESYGFASHNKNDPREKSSVSRLTPILGFNWSGRSRSFYMSKLARTQGSCLSIKFASPAPFLMGNLVLRVNNDAPRLHQGKLPGTNYLEADCTRSWWHDHFPILIGCLWEVRRNVQSFAQSLIPKADRTVQ